MTNVGVTMNDNTSNLHKGVMDTLEAIVGPAVWEHDQDCYCWTMQDGTKSRGDFCEANYRIAVEDRNNRIRSLVMHDNNIRDDVVQHNERAQRLTTQLASSSPAPDEAGMPEKDALFNRLMKARALRRELGLDELNKQIDSGDLQRTDAEKEYDRKHGQRFAQIIKVIEEMYSLWHDADYWNAGDGFGGDFDEQFDLLNALLTGERNAGPRP